MRGWCRWRRRRRDSASHGRSGRLLIYFPSPAAPYCRLSFDHRCPKMSAKVETKSTKKVVVAPKKQAPVRSANRMTGAAAAASGLRAVHGQAVACRLSRGHRRPCAQ